jgi:serine/threonine protein kinase
VDKIVAVRMERELTGKDLGGWTLAECIGFGKSALVFRAAKDGVVGAVKVFDRELVERFGRNAQRERVEREKSLVGKTHPNLIGILDAGEDADSDLFFVVMDLFAGKNIAQALDDIPQAKVGEIIAQVASAAEFLEGLGLAHRDIKPENIGIADDFSRAVLFDLGVLRPVGFSSITDQHGQRAFVGTLQYSPPELLHREEQDSVEGWRAVTYYQLGGVLHDLLTRVPLFADDLTPYAHLVEAVTHKAVSIKAPGAPPELRMLAQDCLVKDPDKRLQLVSWDRFQRPPAVVGDIGAIRERIAQRRKSAAALPAPANLPPGLIEKHAVEGLRNSMERALRDSCKQCDLPPFHVETDDAPPVARVRLVFGPSRTHATTAAFAIYLEGAVMDVAESIVRVSIAAVATMDEASMRTAAMREHTTLLIEGVQADDVLAQRVAEALLVLLDAVQEGCAQGTIGAELMWIDTTGVA